MQFDPMTSVENNERKPLSLPKVLLLLFAILAFPVLIVVSIAVRAESLRVADARPALEPLEALGAKIGAAPVAFHRQCWYSVFFTESSNLSDDNSDQLSNLNALPEGNSVHLAIQTLHRQIFPALEKLRVLSRLDVRASGMSDESIAKLKQALPNTDVWERWPANVQIETDIETDQDNP